MATINKGIYRTEKKAHDLLPAWTKPAGLKPGGVARRGGLGFRTGVGTWVTTELFPCSPKGRSAGWMGWNAEL